MLRDTQPLLEKIISALEKQVELLNKDGLSVANSQDTISRIKVLAELLNAIQK